MRMCPGCRSRMKVMQVEGLNVDSCPKCAGVVLDADEGAVIAVDTGMLFGFNARRLGGDSVDVHFAPCCGGLWMKRSDEGLVRGAARIAVNTRADTQYAAGEDVEPSAATHTGKEKAVVAQARDRQWLASLRSAQHGKR